MSVPTARADRSALLNRGLLLEFLTVGWNLVEGIVAVVAAAASGSVALLGFGVDSFVESISGSVLIWRLGSERRGNADEEAIDRIERRAEQIVAVSFFALAAYVAFDAATSLLNQERPDVSVVGMVLASVSIVVMLWLARAKRDAGEALGSRALIADSHQTFACWYLSVTTLAGLALNAAFGLWWADPVEALVIVVFLVREAREAWEGDDEHET